MHLYWDQRVGWHRKGILWFIAKCNYTISEINKQLHYIQGLLAQYLSSITTDNIKCNKEIQRQFYGNIRKDDVSISQLQVYYDYVDYLIQQDNVY